MSLRNRARALQKKTGLTYQQSLQRLRALGERSAKLRRETGWTLEVCDRFLVDGHAPVTVVEADSSDAPIELLAARSGLDPIQRVCASLRETSAARSVLLVDLRGCVIAQVGRAPAIDPHELDGDRMIVKAAVKTRTRSRYARVSAARALLIVAFDREQSSLGLVRLRMAKAVAELEKLLTDDETPTMPPLGGGGGASGTPAELRVVEPVPAVRPKKKPTPISRKRKRLR